MNSRYIEGKLCDWKRVETDMTKLIIAVIIGFALARVTSLISNSLRANGAYTAAYLVDVLPIVAGVAIILIMRQRSKNF